MRVCEKRPQLRNLLMEQSRLVARARMCVVYWGHTAVSVLPSKLHCSPGSTSARCGVGGVEHRCLSLSHNFSAFIFFFCSTHFLIGIFDLCPYGNSTTHPSHSYTHTHCGVGGEYQSVSSCPVATHVHVTGWWPPHWVTLHCTCVCVRERPKTGNTEITAECLHPVLKCVCKWEGGVRHLHLDSLALSHSLPSYCCTKSPIWSDTEREIEGGIIQTQRRERGDDIL